MIRILIDSSSDYLMEEIQENNFELVPISIVLNGETYIDGKNLERNQFYEIMAETKAFPQTSQPSPQAFLDIFRKSHVKVIAALDTLEYLARGGRISQTVATIGNLANLKPIITLSEDGKVEMIGKCLGKNKAILVSGILPATKMALLFPNNTFASADLPHTLMIYGYSPAFQSGLTVHLIPAASL